ncbi:MAG: tRNA threonylcarbamoyladenosine dehydratase [Clostridia bacterium]|nr:tRNA threonylcarbamoyladenosine dehydratase [Clostridia bacterium]
MESKFLRTEILIGKDAVDKLKKSKVIIFGVGGVGSYAAEAIARSGIGHITLVDDDCVSITNINRQIIAMHSTIGQPKVEVMKKRINDINPCAQIEAVKCFYTHDNSDGFDFSQYDYVIDAVDTVSAKIEIVLRAQDSNVPVISSMGAGNKLDPTAFEISDIYKTSVCPLARVMRYELKKRGVKKLKVVYSKEKPRKVESKTGGETYSRKKVPGSISFVPSAVGLIIASEVVKDLIGETKNAERT